jgi:hypothetical protein
VTLSKSRIGGGVIGLVEAEVHSPETLLDRLTNGVKRTSQPVTFLVGSAFSAPFPAGSPGVPTAEGIIELIKQDFDGAQLADLDSALEESVNPYQTAFSFLQGHRGQSVANDIIKRAVWRARKPPVGTTTVSYSFSNQTADETCRASDDDTKGWYLSPAHRALGRLITGRPVEFGDSVLTTNFDPLVRVAITEAGGASFRTVLHRDGDLGQTQGAGCHVIHLHGYWHGSDTLHTPRQLGQARPRLHASLTRLIAGRTLVVIGYGGWDDIVTRALIDLVANDHLSPEIIWTLYSERDTLSDRLLERLSPGLDRGRLVLYGGVNCHTFLPRLADAWLESIPDVAAADPQDRPYAALYRNNDRSSRKIDFSRGEHDYPPKIDFYVGREAELKLMEESQAKVVFLTGMGGQGKSALAAHYFAKAQDTGCYDHFVWRDCKEESDRFERQLTSIVVAMSGGEVTEHELSTQPIENLTELFVTLVNPVSMLLIFDNIDHYVDLERGTLIGTAGQFVDRFLSSPSKCKVVFTCRPTILNMQSDAMSYELQGIGADDAVALFKLRNAPATPAAITRAHSFTRGHAFWLDLLAAQLARRAPQIDLEGLLGSFDSEELPTATLRSIWNTLGPHERMVLQVLAETVRPTTVLQLSDYLVSRINYNRLGRAVRSLKGLSLLVVKPQDDGQEVIELHPLVRTFVRNNFEKVERDWFIQAILAVYKVFFGVHRSNLKNSLNVRALDHWAEGAELHISAGEYEEAVACLYDIAEPVNRSESPSEFIRVCRLLFKNVSWDIVARAKHFDEVLSTYVEIQALAGQIEECSTTLERYLETMKGKDARYINYCNLKCYTHWANGDFLSALKWGAEGVALKTESRVDTKYDANHNLALAQRDSGAIDPALAYFLRGQQLSDVIEGNVTNLSGALTTAILDAAFT